MTRRFRCFGAVNDELQRFAEEQYRNLYATSLRVSSLDAWADPKIGMSCVVSRNLNMQTELVYIHPNVVIPMHSHPSVDTVDIPILGHTLALKVGDRSLRRVGGAGVRIPAGVDHGAAIGERGLLYFSCQRWNTAFPKSIALDWIGPYLSDEHKELLLRERTR